MGVIYSYYDAKHHVEFNMGKWYGWSDDAVAKLLLPRQLLIGEILAHSEKAWGVRDEEPVYATWLADKLIAFRGDGDAARFLWINDSDDSDDVTFMCAICKEYIGYIDSGCTCEVSQPCKVIGSAYQDDYDEFGRYIEDQPS